VLVDFWATTCPGCVREMPGLMALHREFAPRGFTVIGIAMDYDPPDQVRRMAADRGIPYPVVLDTGGAAARAFGGVMLTPTHFLVAPDGRIAMQVIGEIDFAAVRARLRDWLRG
jgi:peroxiredoxin